MAEFKRTIEVPVRQALEYQTLLSKNYKVENVPELEPLDTFTAVFDNGIEVDIKICNSSDDPYIDPVMFQNGSELQCLDAEYILIQDFLFEVDDDTYTVSVVAKDPIVIITNDDHCISVYSDQPITAIYLDGFVEGICSNLVTVDDVDYQKGSPDTTINKDIVDSILSQIKESEPKIMSKFDVDISWSMNATIYGVEAETEEAAAEIVKNRKLPDGEVSKYSMEIDEIRLSEEEE